MGLHLAVATAHTAQVLDEQLQVVCKRKVVPTVSGFAALEATALAGAGHGTRLEVVIEPTGAAWLPVAIRFTRRSHTVFRVSTQKAHDLRKFLSRHEKSNTIDAHTLARLPLIDPAGLYPVHLPDSAEQAALDRRVRAAARLTDEIGQHKRRLIELARRTPGPVRALRQADHRRARHRPRRHPSPPTLQEVGWEGPHQVLEGRATGQRSTRGDTRRPSHQRASPANPRPSRPAAG